MAQVLDNNLIQTLTECIEFIAHNGHKQVDSSKMKQIKKICRMSEVYIAEAFKIVMHHLSEKHAEVRISSFSIIKELFSKSHHFRELLSADFQEFARYVLDIDPKHPLPPPQSISKQLKLEAIKTIKDWNSTYGDTYKKLKFGFKYLQQSKTVDFDSLDERTIAQRRQDELQQSRLNLAKLKMLESLKDEIAGYISEITASLSEMENGLSLLNADELTSDDLEHHDEHQDTSSSSDLREHGIMPNQEFSLTIDVKPTQLHINADNQDIVNCLREQYRRLESQFWPVIVRWNISAAKAGAEEQLQKRILDLKSRTANILSKCKELGLEQLDSEESSESDLETVPDLESFNDDTLIEAELLSKTKVLGSLTKNAKLQTVSKKGLSALDIESCQASQLAGTIVKFPMSQVESYWVQDPETEQASTDVIIAPVDVSEEFLPVRWACRAPLPSGKLCPRRDRIKCPLHGLIVARDEHGNAVDPTSVQPPSTTATTPDWQEPSLLADIKAATGVDLTMPVKGKRLRKNSFSNLTDIKKLDDTSRKRLGKKIFKREVVRKIASSMDTLDAKWQVAKFGNQWSYS